MSDAAPAPAAPPVFSERPTARIVPDGVRLAAVLGAAGATIAALLSAAAGALLLLAALAVLGFFRNPDREVPGDEAAVVAPADGRVVAAGEIERPDGTKAARVGIFLSVFDVHVNRAPVSGRVLSVARGGARYRAAFGGRAEGENVRVEMELGLPDGRRVAVVQIAGLVARRIVCHPRVGEWVRRGDRYGLIRFGSRTDVVLPAGSEIRVRRGDRVRGGRSVVARLREPA